MGNRSSALADELLVCLWQHEQDVDIAPLVKELGFNTVWTDDEPYHGQAWEETHMYRVLQIPGIKYVIPKIERIQWGQTHEGSIKHARWVAELAHTHPEIIALYLNDFYDEIEEGRRTIEQWREIIAAAKAVNPNLKIVVPHYPHRGNERRPYDFDHDAVIFNLWHHGDIAQVEQHLLQAERQHAGKPVLAGLYLSSGSARGRWLIGEEFKGMLRLFVEHANAGKTAGVRVFCACQLAQRPEYVGWANEVLKDLEPRRGL
ncbi:MAG: hypothetical protein JXA57_18045 [Armatimonadetes bacterium]|nr:hypothetical protein [Armatimonadota bacterium]